jgi:hypothetical protein
VASLRWRLGRGRSLYDLVTRQWQGSAQGKEWKRDGRVLGAREGRLGWYVYLLRDPRTGQIFYIGKGRGDRAFEHDEAAATSVDHPELQSAKAARITELATAGRRVCVDVLRHGISSESLAYEVESAAIDLANKLSPGTLLNVVLGQDAERGLMTAGEIEVLYAAPLHRDCTCQ